MRRWALSVCRMLRAMRLDAGLSVIAIGCAIGRAENTVRRIERGDTEPSGEVVDRWMKRCGMTFDIAWRKAA